MNCRDGCINFERTDSVNHSISPKFLCKKGHKTKLVGRCEYFKSTITTYVSALVATPNRAERRKKNCRKF